MTATATSNNNTPGSGILILTHGEQGARLLDSVSHMLGEVPSGTAAIALVGTERRSEIEQRSRSTAATLHRAHGSVLILTDLYGSTQANIAEKIAATEKQIACVHGVNLAMLLEAVAMRDLPLRTLQRQVLAAARQSILASSTAKKAPAK